MSESPYAPASGPAAAIGLATLSGDQILDVWYPAPALGTAPEDVADIASGINSDDIRDVVVKTVQTEIADLQQPPESVADAYLRLHLLSHRLVRPRSINLDGVFGLLPNIAWTNLGPIGLDQLPKARIRARAHGTALTVISVDKFPRMVDYVVPSGVRIGDADRVRLAGNREWPRVPRHPLTVRHLSDLSIALVAYKVVCPTRRATSLGRTLVRHCDPASVCSDYP